MDCETAVKKIQELLDGLLGIEDGVQVKAHLKTCPGCTAYFRDLKSIERSLKNLPLHRVGPAFNQRVLAALGHQPKNIFPESWQSWAAGTVLALTSAWLTGFVFFLMDYLKPLGNAFFRTKAFFPFGLWPSVEIAILKVFTGVLHLLQAVQGVRVLLVSEIQPAHFALQWALSGLLTAVLILVLSSQPHPFNKRRIS